jgi:hypothetical protein
VYDDMWDLQYLDVGQSFTTIEKRFNDLQVAMRTFTADGNRMTAHPNWKCILRHINGIMDGINGSVRHSYAPPVAEG